MNDNYTRGNVGVVISLVKNPDGTATVVLDDVDRSGDAWRFKRLFTVATFATDAIETVSLTDEELANLGHAVVARIAALSER